MPRAFGDSLQLSDELGVYRIVCGAERVQRRLARREQDAEHRFVLFVSGSDPTLVPPGQRDETASACRFPYKRRPHGWLRDSHERADVDPAPKVRKVACRPEA